MYYVTRDEDAQHYMIWFKKPKYWKQRKCWVDALEIESIRAKSDNFEKVFNLKLKGGKDSIVKVKQFKIIKGE